jgi:hypothetical protein
VFVPHLDLTPENVDGILPGLIRRDWIAIDFKGTFQTTIAGQHRFRLMYDDNAIMWIDAKMTVDGDGHHGLNEQAKSVELAPGEHRIRVLYMQRTGPMVLRLFVTPPGGPERLWSREI